VSTFAQLLRTTRAARGLTFAQIAAEVGYHPSYLSLVERGLRLLDEEGVVRLAQVLGIDPGKALLAALRERLPEDLRTLVPDDLPASTPDNLHAAARQLQAEHFDFEVEEIRTESVVDWDGNVRNLRTYEGCRPNAAGRPIWEITFRDRTVGLKTQEEGAYPKFAVKTSPPDLECELTTLTSELFRTNRLFFPKGWRRSPHRGEDSFSFSIESYNERVYTFDTATIAQRAATEARLSNPLQSVFSYHLPFFAQRLKIRVEMPKGYRPEKWDAWCWWSNARFESVSRNLVAKGAARSFEFRTESDTAEFVINEPLAGYSYAILWTPTDRRGYLEARYGGPDEDLSNSPSSPPGRARDRSPRS
jgi:transcriptional regulator with XRE-family HTH domain